MGGNSTQKNLLEKEPSLSTKKWVIHQRIILIFYIYSPNKLNGGDFVKLWNYSDNRKGINSLWILVSTWDIFGIILIKTKCKSVKMCFGNKMGWKAFLKLAENNFHSGFSFSNLHQWSIVIFPFTGIWFADSHTLLPIQQVHFLKNSYMKIILSLQPCTI